MIDIRPSPSWRDLFQLTRTKPNGISADNLSTPWSRTEFHSFWFSRSYWSLSAIAAWRKSHETSGEINFWIPDYFCNQSLSGVRETGARLMFYPVTDLFSPDWDKCEQIAKEVRPHLFLLVHYFGIPGDVKGAAAFCRRHNGLLIEDCAHVLLPTGEIGSCGDFVIYSPHKLLPLPDGALLMARYAVMEKLGKSAEDFRNSFEKIFSQHAKTSATPWMVKQVLRKIAPQPAIQTYRRLTSKSDNTSDGAELPFQPSQSEASVRLLERQLINLEAYGWCRSGNAALLEKCFQGREGVTFVGPALNESFPYTLGVRFDHEERAADFRARALKSGCPVCTWPDLAPEVLSNSTDHSVAIKIQRQTVFLPVHHSLRIQKLIRCIGNIPRKAAKPARLDLTLRWKVPIDEWERLYSQAPRSHLMQSRAYVRALQETRKWSPRFGALDESGRTMAVFAVLEKHGPIGTVVARLNRGPVWLTDNIECETRIAAIQAIMTHYSIFRGRLLFIAPNILMTKSALQDLYIAGCRRRVLRPWSSIWFDLGKDETILLKGLKGKWRNQLTSAVKNGLTCEISESDEPFEWMIARHKEVMTGRKFEGPTPAFLRRLRTFAIGTGEHFYILRAFHRGQPVAGIAVVTHGTSGTYLLGWNGNEGRRLSANNFLLWHAALALKKTGCTWFELGGFNEWQTPGITAFKRGLQGEEYRLVGEYLNMP